MEVHQLRYFVALARAGNFSRAAEQCHVAQPSLSQQIGKLEQELGERLFDRRGRQTKLTAHGESLWPRALRILEEIESARREISEAQELLRGTLKVGVLPTIAPYLLPAVMIEFTKRFPGLEVVIQEDTTARLLELVTAYEIDFAIASLPIHDDRLEVKPLFTEELLLALPVKHRLARKRALAVGDLKGERLIVMKEGHCLGEQMLGFCDRRDLHPSIAFRSAQLETIQALVQAGLGLSLVPSMARQRGARAPAYRSLQAPRPSRKIVAVWPKLRPPRGGAKEFFQVITQARYGAKG